MQYRRRGEDVRCRCSRYRDRGGRREADGGVRGEIQDGRVVGQIVDHFVVEHPGIEY